MKLAIWQNKDRDAWNKYPEVMKACHHKVRRPRIESIFLAVASKTRQAATM